MGAVRQALADIRARAGELRDAFGADSLARALEWAAERVERALTLTEGELLDLPEAVRRSGYSEGHLARLVREGRIPDMRPPGSKGRILIRASDLPTRPRRPHTESADVHELARRLFGGREGPSGHP